MTFVVSQGLGRLAGITALTAGALLGVSGVASASPGAPLAGDDRAVVHAGNATTCEQAGLPGSTIKVTASVDDTNTYIDMTALPDGVVLTGVVVKGGPNFNVYAPGSLGALPWVGLHAPLVPSGKPAQISHWYACATTGGGETTTTTTAPSTTVPTSTTGAGGGANGESPSTTPAAQGGGARSDELAYTGFGNGWLVMVGGVLLLGGAALLMLVRGRAAAARREH